MAAPREAVVLAAGRGSRLGPLTASRPKCLIEVGGSPILLRLLGRLAQLGIGRAVVVVGYREEMVRRALRDVPVEVEPVANRRYARTGTARSLGLGLGRCRPGAAALVVEGDMVLDDAILERALAAPHPVATVVDGESPEQGSRLAVDAGGHVTGWAHCVDAPPGGSGCKSVNLTVLNDPRAREDLLRFAAAAARTDPAASAERAFDRLCRARPVHAVDVCGRPWAEIDDAADLDAAQRLFAAAEVG